MTSKHQPQLLLSTSMHTERSHVSIATRSSGSNDDTPPPPPLAPLDIHGISWGALSMSSSTSSEGTFVEHKRTASTCTTTTSILGLQEDDFCHNSPSLLGSREYLCDDEWNAYDDVSKDRRTLSDHGPDSGINRIDEDNTYHYPRPIPEENCIHRTGSYDQPPSLPTRKISNEHVPTPGLNIPILVEEQIGSCRWSSSNNFNVMHEGDKAIETRRTSWNNMPCLVPYENNCSELGYPLPRDVLSGMPHLHVKREQDIDGTSTWFRSCTVAMGQNETNLMALATTEYTAKSTRKETDNKEILSEDKMEEFMKKSSISRNRLLQELRSRVSRLWVAPARVYKSSNEQTIHHVSKCYHPSQEMQVHMSQLSEPQENYYDDPTEDTTDGFHGGSPIKKNLGRPGKTVIRRLHQELIRKMSRSKTYGNASRSSERVASTTFLAPSYSGDLINHLSPNFLSNISRILEDHQLAEDRKTLHDTVSRSTLQNSKRMQVCPSHSHQVSPLPQDLIDRVSRLWNDRKPLQHQLPVVSSTETSAQTDCNYDTLSSPSNNNSVNPLPPELINAVARLWEERKRPFDYSTHVHSYMKHNSRDHHQQQSEFHGSGNNSVNRLPPERIDSVSRLWESRKPLDCCPVLPQRSNVMTHRNCNQKQNSMLSCSSNSPTREARGNAMSLFDGRGSLDVSSDSDKQPKTTTSRAIPATRVVDRLPSERIDTVSHLWKARQKNVYLRPSTPQQSEEKTNNSQTHIFKPGSSCHEVKRLPQDLVTNVSQLWEARKSLDVCPIAPQRTDTAYYSDRWQKGQTVVNHFSPEHLQEAQKSLNSSPIATQQRMEGIHDSPHSMMAQTVNGPQVNRLPPERVSNVSRLWEARKKSLGSCPMTQHTKNNSDLQPCRPSSRKSSAINHLPTERINNVSRLWEARARKSLGAEPTSPKLSKMAHSSNAQHIKLNSNNNLKVHRLPPELISNISRLWEARNHINVGLTAPPQQSDMQYNSGPKRSDFDSKSNPVTNPLPRELTSNVSHSLEVRKPLDCCPIAPRRSGTIASHPDSPQTSKSSTANQEIHPLPPELVRNVSRLWKARKQSDVSPVAPQRSPECATNDDCGHKIRTRKTKCSSLITKKTANDSDRHHDGEVVQIPGGRHNLSISEKEASSCREALGNTKQREPLNTEKRVLNSMSENTLRCEVTLLRQEVVSNIQQLCRSVQQQKFVELPNGSVQSIGELTRLLMKATPHQSTIVDGEKIWYFRGFEGMKIWSNLFFGDCHRYPQNDNELDLISFGKKLEEYGIMYNYNPNCEQYQQSFLVLTPRREPNVLNSFLKYNSKLRSTCVHDVTNTILELSHLMDAIFTNSFSMELPPPLNLSNRKKKAFDRKLYDVFQEKVCELQVTSIQTHLFTEEEKLAFHINLYNLMIRHAAIEQQDRQIQWPTKLSDVENCFRTIHYNVGGELINLFALQCTLFGLGQSLFLSPDDDTSLLSSPSLFTSQGYQKQKHSQTSDPNKKNKWWKPRFLRGRNSRHHRSADSCPNFTKPQILTDLRLIFCLSWGTMSSPLVATFYPNNLEPQIQLAAELYCRQHVKVCEDGAIELPQMLQWYQEDFGKTKKEMVDKIASFMSSSQCSMLSHNNKASSKLKIQFSKYDWTCQYFVTPSDQEQQGLYQNDQQDKQKQSMCKNPTTLTSSYVIKSNMTDHEWKGGSKNHDKEQSSQQNQNQDHSNNDSESGNHDENQTVQQSVVSDITCGSGEDSSHNMFH